MNEVQQIEHYLSGTMIPEDRLVMDARLLIDSRLRENVFWQQKTYMLIKNHARKNLRMEIETVHTRLFAEDRFKSFRQKIKNIFK